MSDLRLATLALGLLLLVLSACAQETRPTLEEWTADWHRIRQIVPPSTRLANPPDHETCTNVLGELRSARPELRPAPDGIIGTTADAWIEYAESVFFDCFRSVGSADPVAAAYERLARLEAEVATAIESARSTEDRASHHDWPEHA